MKIQILIIRIELSVKTFIPGLYLFTSFITPECSPRQTQSEWMSETGNSLKPRKVIFSQWIGVLHFEVIQNVTYIDCMEASGTIQLS